MKSEFLDSFLGKLKKTFTHNKESIEDDELESLKNILDQLTNMPVDQARFLAAFSFLLFRVAYADSHVSKEEASEVKLILQKWGGLDESHANLVAEIAKTQNKVLGGTENFLVSREFKEISTPDQKEQLLNALFAVAASDDSISSIESDTIRMISRELGIDHAGFIEVRRKFSDKLEALK